MNIHYPFPDITPLDKENDCNASNIFCSSGPLSQKRKRKRSVKLKETAEHSEKRQKCLQEHDSSLYCFETIPDDIPDINPDSEKQKLSVSPISDISWLGDLEISPTLQSLFSIDNSFSLEDTSITFGNGSNLDAFNDSSLLAPVQPTSSTNSFVDLPHHSLSSFLPHSITETPPNSEASFVSLFGDSDLSSSLHEPFQLNTGLASPMIPQPQPQPQMNPIESNSSVTKMSSVPEEQMDIIRLSWFNNINKSGWGTISPYPRAISKPKKILIEPVRVDSPNLKLIIQIETVGPQQLFILTPTGNASRMEIPVPITQRDNAYQVAIEHEIHLTCNYLRPEQNKGRPLHHIIISDNHGRQLLNWSVEIFNPKWETMTKSQDKPVSEDVCLFAHCCRSYREWKVSTADAPKKNL